MVTASSYHFGVVYGDSRLKTVWGFLPVAFESLAMLYPPHVSKWVESL